MKGKSYDPDSASCSRIQRRTDLPRPMPLVCSSWHWEGYAPGLKGCDQAQPHHGEKAGVSGNHPSSGDQGCGPLAEWPGRNGHHPCGELRRAL